MKFQTSIIFLTLWLWGAAGAQAQSRWLTVTGDPANPAVNTIQVDPTPVSVSANGRVMWIRVSRSAPRTSWDGVAYQSYRAQVVFDCPRNSARYMSIDFYLAPIWQGEPYQTSVYGAEAHRLMRFLDVTPNPTARIVRAACESASVMSN